MRKPTKYDNMNAGDLARITRELGLQKPDVLSIVDWADWLAEQDNPTKTVDVEVVEDELDTNDEPTSDYNTLSNTKLRKLAKERGINLHDRVEIIDALQAADGFTEDEQAQMDDALDGEAS